MFQHERFPVRRFGPGLRLAAALLLMLAVTHLAGRLAERISQFCSALDPEHAFAWLWTHHLLQLSLTLGAMRLWSGASLQTWGFNLQEARVGLRWFGAFALYCTLGMILCGIVPMLWSHRLPQLGFTLNARNVVGTLSFYYLLSGTGEEPLFRGLVMLILLRAWPGEVRLGKVVMPVAGLWATLLFMLAHVNFALAPFRITQFSIPQQLFCLGFGLFYAAAFYRTRSLLCPVLAHGFSNGIIWTLIYLALALSPAPPAQLSRVGEPSITPNPPIAGQEVTITYRAANGPLTGATRLNLHYGFDGWNPTHDAPMAGTNDLWILTFQVPRTARMLDYVFTDGTTWDNHGGRDWHARTQRAP